eukprot:3937408-Rhodomonas_salina.1
MPSVPANARMLLDIRAQTSRFRRLDLDSAVEAFDTQSARPASIDPGETRAHSGTICDGEKHRGWVEGRPG